MRVVHTRIDHGNGHVFARVPGVFAGPGVNGFGVYHAGGVLPFLGNNGGDALHIAAARKFTNLRSIPLKYHAAGGVVHGVQRLGAGLAGRRLCL